MQPELLLALEANVAATRQAIDDSSSLAELDIQFHNLIPEASQNRAIQLACKPPQRRPPDRSCSLSSRSFCPLL